MATTARISNIESTTTKDSLTTFLEKKGLPLAVDQPLSLTSTQDLHQVATVTFLDNATLKRALGLPPAERRLNGRNIHIDADFDGFTILSEGTEVDIVALHGLNGHAFTTWEYRYDEGGSFMWLRDSLAERIPDARILIYGFRADVLSDVQTGRIRTFSETFLEKLRQLREDNASRNRRLILIGYSMGGLIIKQALLVASSRADGQYTPILNSVGGIIFLGTPHRGGYGIDAATTVAHFLHPLNVSVRIDLIKSLHPNSMILFDLTDDFRQLVEAKGIGISTLYEIKKTVWGHWPAKHRFLVVGEQSAILGIAREMKVAVNSDHAHLCKFKTSTDDSLLSVVHIIKEWERPYKPAIVIETASSQPLPPDDLTYISLAHQDRDDPNYPILQYDQYSYWALSYADKRDAMAILAYDKKGQLVGRWSKNGSRYVSRIEYDEEKRQVSFVGEGNTSIAFSLNELKVSG